MGTSIPSKRVNKKITHYKFCKVFIHFTYNALCDLLPKKKSEKTKFITLDVRY